MKFFIFNYGDPSPPPFFKVCLFTSITAFGGPQAHIAMMMKTFVSMRRPYVTKEELLEYNGVLPTFSRSVLNTNHNIDRIQTRWGVELAVLTLIIWISAGMSVNGSIFLSLRIY